MSIETIQRILLAGLPVYFYFVPDALFPFFYDRYVRSVYYSIQPTNSFASKRINVLKSRVSRVLRFVAFLSIVVVTLISTVYSKEHHEWFYRDCVLLSLLIGLVGISAWMAYLNFKKKLGINKGEEWLERIVLILTMPLLYFWG
jgi:hypothetical protein